MYHAGLTRGGFYSYFKSKSDLYVEVLGCFLTDPNRESTWEGIQIDLASGDAGPQIVSAYLSRQHFENVENSCPMVALPCDVARSGEKVKTAFEEVFKKMVALLQRDIRSNSRRREDTALAIAAMCVGGMVIARSIHDEALSNRLRHAATAVALGLCGWAAVGRSDCAKQTRGNLAAAVPRSKGTLA